MSGSFYLNPVTIKFQCGAAKNKLGKAILQTKRIEESLNEFINNEEIQKVMSQISPKLSPDDKFWRSLSETVEGAFYPEGMRGELGKQVHLLR